METDERHLIGSDYRVGFPLSVRYRFLEGRLTLQHSSSHIGDDYVKRYGVWVYQVSREALELILAVRPIAPVRLYGGGDLNVGRGFDFGVDDDFYGKQFTPVEQWVLRFGAEYDPSWAKRGTVQPFLGANFETTDWTQRLATTVRGGVAFRINSIRILLDAQYRDGPSAMGQFRLDPDGFENLDEEKPFRGVDEQMFGFGLEVQIGGLVAPGPAGS
jgi:extradiol dioxygenase family protein